MRSISTIAIIFCLVQICDGLHARERNLIFHGSGEVSLFGISESYTDTQSFLFLSRLKTGFDFSHSGNWGIRFNLFTRAYAGNFVEKYPGYSFLRYNRYDWLNLTHTWSDQPGSLILSRIDRAYIYYYTGDFEFKLGRQLIHWGQTLIWNVNDIFNTHSLLDADRPVKLGSDAARIIWYTGPESVMEFAAKLNGHGEATAAVMGRFNHSGIEWQWQTGLVEQKDWMFGAGLTANIRGLGMRSELGWYLPLGNSDNKQTLMASFGVDFLFASKFICQGEILYNQLHDYSSSRLFSNLYSTTASPKKLSISEWSATINLLYPLTGQTSIAFSSFYFHDYHALIVYPSINWSKSNNLKLSASFRLSNFELEKINYSANIISVSLLYDY